jgi:hypothetical protein
VIWPFRKRETNKRSEFAALVDHLLLSDDATYVSLVREAMKGLSPNGVVMVIVGYKTIKNLLIVSKRVLQKYNDSSDTVDARNLRAMATTEGLFAELLSQYEATKTETPAKWRINWLIQGLMLLRAEQLGENNCLYQDALADTWIELSKNTMSFSVALEKNALWSEEEKEAACFEYKNGLSKPDSTKWIFLHKMPRMLRSNHRAVEFCRQNGWPLVLLGG